MMVMSVGGPRRSKGAEEECFTRLECRVASAPSFFVGWIRSASCTARFPFRSSSILVSRARRPGTAASSESCQDMETLSTQSIRASDEGPRTRASFRSRRQACSSGLSAQEAAVRRLPSCRSSADRTVDDSGDSLPARSERGGRVSFALTPRKRCAGMPRSPRNRSRQHW